MTRDDAKIIGVARRKVLQAFGSAPPPHRIAETSLSDATVTTGLLSHLVEFHNARALRPFSVLVTVSRITGRAALVPTR